MVPEDICPASGYGRKNISPDIPGNSIENRIQRYPPGRDSLPEEQHSQDLDDKRPDADHQIIVKLFGFLVLIRLYGEPHERLGP